jgi:hypothetical protein
MNCFEARMDFAVFWRRAMPLAERARLVEHLAACTQCDRSFRVFALSAPVVYSEAEPGGTATTVRSALNLVRPRRFATARPSTFARPRPESSWRTAAVAAVLLMIGGFAAWSSTRAPAENFAESVVADSPDVEAARTSFDPAATAIDADAQAPALFDAIAPDPSAPGDNGLAG